jgi:hypothetical protein
VIINSKAAKVLKVMVWVAFDRVASELEAQAYHESGQRWREIADEIHAEVCERGFDRYCCIMRDNSWGPSACSNAPIQKVGMLSKKKLTNGRL